MNKELDLILQKKLKESSVSECKHENHGIDNLKLYITGAGNLPLLDLFRPDVITTTRLSRDDVKFEINQVDDGKIDTQFYYVFGKMAGMTKSLPLAADQIFDQDVKDILHHNKTLLEDILKDVYDACLRDYPDGVIPAMKTDRYGPLM